MSWPDMAHRYCGGQLMACWMEVCLVNHIVKSREKSRSEGVKE